MRGIPLIRRAVGSLVRAGVVDQVVVACPRSLLAAVTRLTGDIGGPTGTPVTVHATDGPGPGHRVLQVLTGFPPAGTVVVHDPLHPLASAELVRRVAQVLAESPPDVHAVVPVRPVTDTLKWVDDAVVQGTADRENFRMVYSPQGYRGPALLGALRDAAGAGLDADLDAPGADALPRLVQRAGGRLVSVPAPGEVFRIATAEDLHLAEAMLHVGADRDDEYAGR